MNYFQVLKGYEYTWAEASDYCKKAEDGSGHLARIYNKNTMDFLSKMLRRRGKGKRNSGGKWDNFFLDLFLGLTAR